MSKNDQHSRKIHTSIRRRIKFIQQIKFILIVIINICIYISKSETQSFSSRNL